MTELPSGTITFLFSDIEGSTRLLEKIGAQYASVLDTLRRLLRAAFQQWHGYVVDSQGDSFFVAFGRATDAMGAALQAQRALTGESWPGEAGPRVRMGIHTGEALLTGDGYVGLDVHRAARLAAVGHGGQVLLSQASRALVESALPEDVRLRDLGEHRLKDLQRPERISQLVAAGLPAEFPALRTLDAHRHNLPILPTPLIGREKELAAAKALLLRDDVRLVTLTGPGGSGKTRLALQLAAAVIDRFADGIYFVGLAPVVDPTLIAPSIARAIGVHEVGGRPIEETLKDYLRGKRLLLVLDNFEQLLPAASFVAELVAACPTILVTSRAVLHVYGEHDFPVPPLQLPNRKPVPPIGQLTQYEAVRLFIDRARAARPEFAVDDDNAPAVAEICHRLDGLPLAIELAAARVRLLLPQAMLARLERRLSLLTGGARDLPSRQRSLRATIQWSHDLLEPEEKLLFRRFGVFLGGASVEAVEALWDMPVREGDAPSSKRGISALEGLASLVDKSLLRQEERENGEPRFWMLETIREYAIEQLTASGEDADARRAHAHYYLSLAEEVEPKLRGAAQAAGLATLEAEHDNLRAALTWCGAEPGREETALRLAGALTWFWRMRGHLSEGCQWLEAVLLETAGARREYRVKALTGGAFLFHGQRAHAQATKMLEEALALARLADDKVAVGWALHVLARVARDEGDQERGVKLLQESLTVFHDAQDVLGSSYSTWLLGSTLSTQGKHEEASVLLAQGLALARQAQDPWSTGSALHHAALLACFRADYEGAIRAGKESLQLFHQLQAPWGVCHPLRWLAMAAAGRAEWQRAAQLFGADESVRESIGLGVQAFYRTAYERSIASTRTALGASAFDAARLEGRAMPLDAIVHVALEE